MHSFADHTSGTLYKFAANCLNWSRGFVRTLCQVCVLIFLCFASQFGQIANIFNSQNVPTLKVMYKADYEQNCEILTSKVSSLYDMQD